MSIPINIVISVLQGAAARGELDRTGNSVKGMGDKVEETGRRFNKNGREIDKFGRFVKKAGDEAAATGGKLAQMEARAKGAINAFEGAQRQTENLRNLGLGITTAGAGMLYLSQKFREAATEGDGVSQRLESILKQQQRLGDSKVIDEQVQRVTVEGHFADDDEIKNAAVLAASYSVQTKDMGEALELSARQARTMNRAVDGVAEAFAKAYGTGNVAALRRSGVLLSDQETAAVKAAYGISQTVGQMKFMEVVGAAIRNNTVALGDSLTDAQKASNDLARAGDDAMTALGRGANNAAAMVGGIGTSALVAANQFPGFLEGAGYVGHLSGMAVTATGTLITFGSQIGMTAMGFQAMGITGTTAWTAIGASATAAGAAMWAAIAPILPLVLAIGAAMGAITAVAVWWQNKKKAEAEAEGLEADRKYFEVSSSPKNKHRTASDPKEGESFDDWRKRTGRGAENSEDTATDTTKLDESMAKLREIEAKGLTSSPVPRMPSMPSEPDEEYDEPPAPRVRREAPELDFTAAAPTMPAVAIDNTIPSSGNAARDARVKRALDAGATGDETFPNGILDGSKEDARALDAAIQARRRAGTLTTASAGSGPLALSAGPDPYKAQIRALQEEMRNTKDKGRKAELRLQIQALQDAKDAARKNEAAAKKANADAARQASIAAKGSAAVMGVNAAGEADEIRDARTEAKEIAQDALDDELDKIKRAMKAKTISQTAGSEKMQALRDVFEAEQAAADAAADAQIKLIQARTKLAEAATIAATQSGAEKEATMAKANADAARLRRGAERDARKAQRETRNAMEARAEANKPREAGVDLNTSFAKFLQQRRRGPKLVEGSFGADATVSGGQSFRVAEAQMSQGADGGFTFVFPPLRVPNPLAQQRRRL